MFTDYRDYLDQLEKVGKLLRVSKEIDVRFEIAAGIRKTSDTDGPALLFENIRGYPGWRVAGGLFATRKLLAFALGVAPDDQALFQRYLECEPQRVKPRRVPAGPARDVIVKGDDIDLARLPIPTYCEKDGGPYVDTGVEIARHPETGVQNLSIVRRKVLGKDRLGLLAPPMSHLGIMLQAAEKQGRGLGVATVLGAHPALVIASQLKPPLGVDEMEIAGAFRQQPFDVMKCETVDVDVPADAEIVIEGVSVPGEKAEDGPFGEAPGNYVSLFGAVTSPTWVVKVTAITMRRDPIFQACLTGMPMTENQWLSRYAKAVSVYRELLAVVDPADIKGVAASASALLHTVVSIRKTREDMGKDVIRHLLTCRIPSRRVVVVDDDINIYDPFEVEWAIATRTMPERDVIVMPVSRVVNQAIIDMTRWGIDATAPLGQKEWYARAVPPGVDKVDYLPRKAC